MTNQHDNQDVSNAGTQSATSNEQADWGSEGIDAQQAGGGQSSVSDTSGDWGSSGDIIADTTTPGDESTEDDVQTGGKWGERETGWYGVDKTRVIAAVAEEWGSQGIDPDDDGISPDWGSHGVDADEEIDSTDTLNHIPHH